MRHTIARSSKQYGATIPRRRSGEAQHEDQRRGPMIPSDKLTLPEKSAQRYVFLDRPTDYAALLMERTPQDLGMTLLRKRYDLV
jgi:hypothetical protein